MTTNHPKTKKDEREKIIARIFFLFKDWKKATKHIIETSPKTIINIIVIPLIK